MKNYLVFLKYRLVIVLCALAITSCGSSQRTILDGLDQTSANNVLVELNLSNIDAEKLKDKLGLYSILVPKDEEYRALTLIKHNANPVEKYVTLGEVFKKDSFISSPLEEQARFIYALEEQISAMVAAIDGVTYVSTQVSLPLPSDNLIQGQTTQASASVFIKYKDAYHLEMYANRIKQLVANSVPGLTADRVEVLFMDQKDIN